MRIISRSAVVAVILPLITLACDAGEAADSLIETVRAETRGNAPLETVGFDSLQLAEVYAEAAELPRLHSLLVARHGTLHGEEYFGGPGEGGYANLKSVSKSVLSAVVGIAIAEGHLSGLDQPVAPFFEEYLSDDEDPRKREITVGHLLAMQSGLERTSGGNYGAWVTSPNWVEYAITRPMDDEPGGRMLYSTGNSHLLSAILTEATGMSTWAYARDRLAEPLGIELPRWPTDPQGIYFGGNDMLMTPRGMVRFGELYRSGGMYNGGQILPVDWVRDSRNGRARSRWSGEDYGLGWFIREMGGYPGYYAWGYGGQYIFVIPELELTVVTTSNPDTDRERGHLQALRDIVELGVIPAAEAGA